MFFSNAGGDHRRKTAWSVLTVLVLCGAIELRWSQAADVIPSQIVDAKVDGEPDKFRKILASPTVNTPEPFQGFGGYCGWPDVCRLQNGDLYVSYTAGYYHGSWPTPLDLPPGEDKRDDYRDVYGFLLDWDCPTGGKIVSIRSQDNGKTWTKPKYSFPVVPGAYWPADVIQLRDGTMLATGYIQKSMESVAWKKMPATPLEFAQAAINRLPPENVFFRSDDNGETWREISRYSFYGLPAAVFSLCESPDGSILAIYNFSPIPAGPGWPTPKNLEFGTRWLTAVARSSDKGNSWEMLSVTGSNDFDSTESTGGYLPDGSIGFMTRPTSHWFQSFDNGVTWTTPKKIFSGGAGVDVRRGSLQVTPDGVIVLAYCASGGGDGQVIYSRDNGQSWIKPAEAHGFHYDPIAYYPDTCVLEDGTIFSVGMQEGLGQNEYGPHGAQVTSMRFRIKSAEEGEGIELLPVGGPAVK